MKVVIHPNYTAHKQFISALPRIFTTQGTLLYQGRNILKVFEHEDLKLCVKSFQTPILLNQFAYRFIRPSKAQRSYEYSMELLRRGVLTPQPIAYIESSRCGLLKEAYYLSINQDYTGMLRELRQGQLAGREPLLRAFAQFVAYLHQHQILHKDLSPGNVLYQENDEHYQFYLVDVNRMQFKTIDKNTAYANFRRLWGSEEMLLYLAKEYALAQNWDIAESQEQILHYHQAFWKRYSRRHEGFLPYLG